MNKPIQRNIECNLKNNAYPGRGIIVGANTSGKKLIQVYWIMGRSENSQNRIFVLEDDVLRTEPYDSSKVKDPSLIIYNALRHFDNYFIIANGDHCDTAFDFLHSGETFEGAMAQRSFEPDGPHYTPRIAGLIIYDPKTPAYKLSILKAENNDPRLKVKCTWDYDKFKKGLGHCIHTYWDNGNPLPPFEGAPYEVDLGETIDEIGKFYWNTLNQNFRIALAVKSIDKKTKEVEYKIINRLKKP